MKRLYQHFKWGSFKYSGECYYYRHDPVPNVSNRHRHNRRYRHSRIHHLMKMYGHEDYKEYNCPVHNKFIGMIKVWGDRPMYSTVPDKSWKSRKIKYQYLKHKAGH